MDFVGSDADLVQNMAHLGEPCGSGEQELAKVALAGQDAFAALLQGVVVEGEHRLVGGAVEGAEVGKDHAFGDRLIAGAEQAALGALDAGDAVHPALGFQHGADAHRGVGVQEVIATAHFDPIEQVENGGQGGRFARLVRPVDDV